MGDIRQFLPSYVEIVRAYADDPSEQLLYECTELGKRLAVEHCSAEEMVVLHQDALGWLDASLTSQQIISTMDLLTELTLQQALLLERETELRGEAETERSRQAKLMESVVSSFPDALIRLSPDLEIIGHNEKLQGLFPGVVLNKMGDLLDRFADRGDFSRLVTAAQHVQQRQTRSSRLLSMDGDVIPCEVTVLKLGIGPHQGDGGGYLCILRDMREQIEASARLRSAQQMVNDVIEAVPLRLYWKDADLTYRGCNNAYLEDICLELDAIYGRCSGELSAHAQKFSMVELEEEVLSGRTPFVQQQRSIDLDDGAQIHIKQTVYPLRGDETTAYGVICCYEDIGELKRTEAENSLLTDQLHNSERLDALGRLAGGIAHDFNNILSVIIGYAQLIERETPANTHNAIADNVRQISGAANKAKLLVERLLTFSQKKPVQPSRVELFGHIKAALESYRPLFGEEILISLRSERNFWISADASHLDQVILNLLVNAKDALDALDALKGQREKRIDISLSKAPDALSVRVVVADCGVGMSKDTQRKVFEPFFSTKGGSGTGLGLSTVLGIVRQNNGEITIDSMEGHGTTITIDWPLTTAPMVVAADVGERSSIDRDSLKSSDDLAICIVEDEEPVRTLITSVLLDAGYAVFAFASGKALFDFLDQESVAPALLISDILLSDGESGRDVGDQFLLRFPSSKLIYASGYNNESIPAPGTLGGNAVYITKPFDIDRLVTTVDECVSKRQEADTSLRYMAPPHRG